MHGVHLKLPDPARQISYFSELSGDFICGATDSSNHKPAWAHLNSAYPSCCEGGSCSPEKASYLTHELCAPLLAAQVVRLV